MSRRLVLMLAALAVGGCNPGPMLKLEVLNESQADAVIEVLGPDGANAGFHEIVQPQGGVEVAVERPGPGGWTVTVNGRPVAGWEEWPSDNPVIDLTLLILIRPDGSVEVRDA